MGSNPALVGDPNVELSTPIYRSIGGPLVLLSMGLVLSVYLEVATLWETLVLLNRHELTGPLRTFALVMLITQVPLLVLTLWVCRLYFFRYKSAPRWLLVLLWLGLIVDGLTYLYARSIPELRPWIASHDELLLVTCILRLLWTPYLLFSRRVQRTFVF